MRRLQNREKRGVCESQNQKMPEIFLKKALQPLDYSIHICYNQSVVCIGMMR